MKCPVCSTEFEGARCPNCGCPVFFFSGEPTAAEKEIYENTVEEYRKKWFSAEFYLSVYKNRWNNDTVEIESSEDILLCNLRELVPGSICWYPEKFARLSGESNNLSLSIKKADGSFDRKYINIKNPEVDPSSFWQVGVELVGEKTVRLVLGNEECHSTSENIFVQ